MIVMSIRAGTHPRHGEYVAWNSHPPLHAARYKRARVHGTAACERAETRSVADAAGLSPAKNLIRPGGECVWKIYTRTLDLRTKMS